MSCVCVCVVQVDSYPSAASQILLVAQFKRFFLLFLPIVPSEQTKALSAAQKPANSVQRHSNEVKCAACFCPGRWLQHQRCCCGRRKWLQKVRGREAGSRSIDPAGRTAGSDHSASSRTWAMCFKRRSAWPSPCSNTSKKKKLNQEMNDLPGLQVLFFYYYRDTGSVDPALRNRTILNRYLKTDIAASKCRSEPSGHICFQTFGCSINKGNFCGKPTVWLLKSLNKSVLRPGQDNVGGAATPTNTGPRF